MDRLVESIEASPQARERAQAILRTLAQKWSVQAGCRCLGVGRTRFQDLRQRMLGAAVAALEEGAAGRPRRQVQRTCRQLSMLRRRLAELEQELRRTQAELDVARSEAGAAVSARLAAKRVRR
jgi:DNA-binding HxlR family transcriptional regulator